MKIDIDFHRERHQIVEDIIEKAINFYENKEKEIGKERMRFMEKMFYLQAIDFHWKNHLYGIDYLKEGIFLRAYGQRDPLVEFQHEAFLMFEEMLKRIEESVVGYIFRFQVQEEHFRSVFEEVPQEFVHEEYSSFNEVKKQKRVPSKEKAETKVIVSQGTYKREGRKIGRNEPCPCGSGKKYKHCCGKNQ